MDEYNDQYLGGTTRSSRSSSWILSCDAWQQQGAYIVLPINPGQLSFDLGVRTSNEMARAAQLIYVWRYLGNSSTLVKPTIKLTVNSGYIVPSFDPSLILECASVVSDRAQAVDLGLDSATQQRLYEAKLSNYTARIPQPEQTRDYIGTGVYKDIGLALRPNHTLTDTSTPGNLPGIYTDANKNVPIGIQNLYAMFSLADERRIRKVLLPGDAADTPTGGQTENRISLTLSTMVFPKLTVYGWFGESGISYTENAEEPGSFDMSFEIVVSETVPSLSFGNWNHLMQAYTDGMVDSATTLDHARSQFQG